MSDLRLNHFEPVLTSYLRSGPVIWGLAIIGNRLRLRSVKIWPKNRTGPDFQTLLGRMSTFFIEIIVDSDGYEGVFPEEAESSWLVTESNG